MEKGNEPDGGNATVALGFSQEIRLPYILVGAALIVLALIAYLRYAKSALADARAAPLAQSLALQRQKALTPPSYRAVRPEDSALAIPETLLTTMRRDLTALGFLELGTSTRLGLDGSAEGIVHWFRDDTSTICGWLAAVPLPNEPVPSLGLLLFSESADGR